MSGAGTDGELEGVAVFVRLRRGELVRIAWPWPWRPAKGDRIDTGEKPRVVRDVTWVVEGSPETGGRPAIVLEL